jgi:hypothetical protein
MDPGEKLFMRASKAMFERKCSQIAAYEAITKLERLVEEESELDYQKVDNLIQAIDSAKAGVTGAVDEEIDAVNESNLLDDDSKIQVVKDLILVREQFKIDFDRTKDELSEIARQARKTKQAVHTTWVVDPDDSDDALRVGRGSGVIELTLVDTITTNLSIGPRDPGSFSLSIQDPYNFMNITQEDIEIAINSAFRAVKDLSRAGSLDQLDSILEGPAELLEKARRKEEELRDARNNRFLNVATSLSGSNLSEIIFEIRPGATAANSVTGRITSVSEPFTRTNYGIVFSQLPTALERLTLEEDRLVNQIFELLERYVTAINRISLTTEEDEDDPYVRSNKDYVRRQMRKCYLGKPMVQPMDGIHIFLRGNTAFDYQNSGPLSAFINSAPFIRGFASGENDDNLSEDVLREELRQFGVDEDAIPIDLYRSIRTGSLLRNAGTHVFGGLVSNVSESYRSGSYILNVSGESNLKWLKLSRANTTPSLEQVDQVLEDPLTPLDIKVDPSTGLIDGTPPLSEENKRRAAAGILLFNDGTKKGGGVTESSLGQDIVIRGNVAYVRKKHAPGLVYKWKEGVISATSSVNLRSSFNGDDSSTIRKLRRDVGVNVVKDPFANLDIVDAISLMVTGYPHNLESFVISSSAIGTFTTGNTNSPESFFHSFFDITRSTNRALGNFEPFKPNDISSKEMADRLNKQMALIQENDKVKKLESSLARVNDNIQNASESVIEILEKSRTKIESDLRKERRNLRESIENGKDSGLRVYADNIILDDANLQTEESDGATTEKANKTAQLRTKVQQLRTQLRTKFNKDSNLFIVSDEYDKDLDLQAFAIDLASGEIPLWKSDFKEPLDICVRAASVMDLEFFCDTQGHIRLQPPKYNKIPLSLLLKMILLSEEKNINLLSPFVKSLFASKKKGLENTRDILETEIKIINLTLFGEPETDSKLVDRSVAAPDSNIEVDDDDDVSSVVGLIQAYKKDLSSLTGSPTHADNTEELKAITKEVKELNTPSTRNFNTRRLNKLNKLRQLTSQLERVNETLKRMDDQENREQSNGGKAGNVPDGFRKNVTPEQIKAALGPFGNLIEDDFNDFLGPGSAKRFVITDDQIISYDFKESDSNVYCRVDVVGQEDLLGESPGQIGSIPYIWAGATDFDLWKQYGWRVLNTEPKPFFKNAETQCAPYALMLLTRQRRDTVRATVTVTGNEYYQLGDVVYINSRDMLYYVQGVSHNFSYSGNGNFQTTLDLRYGHPVGEFIPTPLDVIGKNLIKNQRKFNTTFVARRTASKSIGRNISVVILKNKEFKEAEDLIKEDLLNGSAGKVNLVELKNTLILINSIKDRSDFEKVEIRGYAVDEDDKDLVLERMKAVEKWLKDPIAGFDDNDEPIKLNNKQFKALESSLIKEISDEIDPVILEVDEETGKLKNEDNIGRTPSEEVFNISIDPTQSIDGIEIRIKFKEES